MDLYYKHSGAFSPADAAIGLMAGLAACIPLAFVYAYLILYLPVAGYITFLLAAGFGALMGSATGLTLKSRHVRNVPVAAVAGVVVGLVGLYASWGVWTYAFLRRADVKDASLGALLFQPALLARLVTKINEVGAWSIKSATPTGVVLGLLWLVEAVIIVGASVLVAVSVVNEHAFCESCSSWCQRTEGVALMAAQAPNTVKGRMERKDMDFLVKLGAPKPGAMEWLRFDLEDCTGCQGTHTVSVKWIKVSVDKKGKRSESDTRLVDKLLLSATEAETVRGLGRKLASPAPAAAAATA